MTNIVRRMILGSNSSSGSNKKIIRSREDIIHEDYLEWKIPNEKIDNIYSIGTFDFKMINTSIQEETVLLQIEAEHSKTFVPRRLKWNEITIPEELG